MNTVIFMSQSTPERNLVKEINYKIRPDSDTKEKLINEIKTHINDSLERYIIDVDIRVTLKEYDTKNT